MGRKAGPFIISGLILIWPIHSRVDHPIPKYPRPIFHLPAVPLLSFQKLKTLKISRFKLCIVYISNVVNLVISKSHQWRLLFLDFPVEVTSLSVVLSSTAFTRSLICWKKTLVFHDGYPMFGFRENTGKQKKRKEKKISDYVLCEKKKRKIQFNLANSCVREIDFIDIFCILL